MTLKFHKKTPHKKNSLIKSSSLHIQVLHSFPNLHILISTGCLTSQDDYYIRDNGIILSETTLDIYNNQLFSDISLQDFIPSFFKLATSNFLADSAVPLHHIFFIIRTFFSG